MQFQLVGYHLLPFFLSTRIMSSIQKHILVSAYSHCRISHFPCAPSEGKRSCPTIKVQFYLHLTILPTLDENTELREHQGLLILLTQIAANQWVLHWALSSFSNWFSTWASSLRELQAHLGARCLPHAEAELRVPNLWHRKPRALCWKGARCVADTKDHKDLLTQSAELKAWLSTAPTQSL